MTYGKPCHAIAHFVFYYHHVTYRTPCHASGHLVIYRECYGGVFCLTLLPASFKAYLGAGNSTSRLAGLHNDLRNIAPDRLFVWITRIHKRDIHSRFTYGLRLVDYVNNLLLTGFELSSQQAKHAKSLMFYPFNHRATQSTINW